jgi:hypothetical protein
MKHGVMIVALAASLLIGVVGCQINFATQNIPKKGDPVKTNALPAKIIEKK